MPADDDDDHPDRQDEDVGVLQDDVRQVRRAEEVRVEQGEEEDDRHQGDDDAALPQVAGHELPDARDTGHLTCSFSMVISAMSDSWVASAAGSCPVMRPAARV